jgi:hypothetical protein
MEKKEEQMARPTTVSVRLRQVPGGLYDGHNIVMCYVCDECKAQKVATFRRDIFENYECDESIGRLKQRATGLVSAPHIEVISICVELVSATDVPQSSRIEPFALVRRGALLKNPIELRPEGISIGAEIEMASKPFPG